MQYSEIMIRYGELSTKGKNRMRFINKLRNNISDVLSIYPQVKVTADRDRAHAYLNGADYTAVAESLKQVFGIQNFSPVYKVEKSVEVLKSAVQEIMQDIYKEGMTFKISSKRSDHTFELDSRELNQTLGGAVFEAIPNVQAQKNVLTSIFRWRYVKKQPIFLMKPFEGQVDYQWELLVRACSCCQGESIPL